ncbi:hypothetical protein HPP92_014338 [Vanilla planifolia]|uniref:Protein kinase domain-containing protein n=1 Tax=Vanilla planifolia TaxID=51239 RepID=A0A835QZH6_VANPL|nr:hypothetical protein HPP92_014338 [Vanilla planifolia]
MGNCFSNSGKSPAPTEPSAATAASDMNLDPSTAPRSPSPPIHQQRSPSSPPPIGPVLGRPMEDVRHTYPLARSSAAANSALPISVPTKRPGSSSLARPSPSASLPTPRTSRTSAARSRSCTTSPDHRQGAFLRAGGRVASEDHRADRAYLYSMGVMHRDLKPENFLLLSKAEDAPSRLLTFGLSVFFKPGEVFRDIVGSAYYIAPEVLKRKYGPEVDIWSIGVMLYILLCGVPPFWSESEHGIFKAILEAPVDLKSDPGQAYQMELRISLRRCSAKTHRRDHPWIKEDGEAPDTPLDNAVLNRLKQFRELNKFKQVALRVKFFAP